MIIDVNAYLGHYPFRQVSAAENHTCGLYEIHTQGKQAVK